MATCAKYIISFLLCIALSSAAMSQTRWKPVTASVSFHIKNFGTTVNGSFKGFKGDLVFDPANLPASRLTASVNASTINTDNTKRDNHLRSEDYFYVDKYSEIKVESKSITKKGDGYEGAFIVTIRGIAKPETIDFNFEQTGDTAVFEGSFTINRLDFKVGSSSLILSNDATINIVVNARK